jgi:hypothetical protein
MLLSEAIKPVSYVKAHASEILRNIVESGQPVIVTENSRIGSASSCSPNVLDHAPDLPLLLPAGLRKFYFLYLLKCPGDRRRPASPPAVRAAINANVRVTMIDRSVVLAPDVANHEDVNSRVHPCCTVAYLRSPIPGVEGTRRGGSSVAGSQARKSFCAPQHASLPKPWRRSAAARRGACRSRRVAELLAANSGRTMVCRRISPPYRQLSCASNSSRVMVPCVQVSKA